MIKTDDITSVRVKKLSDVWGEVHIYKQSEHRISIFTKELKKGNVYQYDRANWLYPSYIIALSDASIQYSDEHRSSDYAKVITTPISFTDHAKEAIHRDVTSITGDLAVLTCGDKSRDSYQILPAQEAPPIVGSMLVLIPNETPNFVDALATAKKNLANRQNIMGNIQGCLSPQRTPSELLDAMRKPETDNYNNALSFLENNQIIKPRTFTTDLPILKFNNDIPLVRELIREDAWEIAKHDRHGRWHQNGLWKQTCLVHVLSAHMIYTHNGYFFGEMKLHLWKIQDSKSIQYQYKFYPTNNSQTYTPPNSYAEGYFLEKKP